MQCETRWALGEVVGMFVARVVSDDLWLFVSVLVLWLIFFSLSPFPLCQSISFLFSFPLSARVFYMDTSLVALPWP